MLRFLTLATIVASGLPLIAKGTTAQETEFFEKKVRPVLAEHCYKCHGPEKQKAELRLDSRQAVLKGSDAGAVVIPGKPDESVLIKSVRHEGEIKMPEKDDKLTEEQIAALTEWVKLGVPWPENDATRLTSKEEAARKHWSYQPVRRPVPPKDAGWGQSPIDQFILAKLRQSSLTPGAPASRRTLLRRASFDLLGLPPTAEEVENFENDSSPDAFARVVDRLLASPHYGERWGRYWLDVARYADTKGYVFQEERRYPFAYTYRDWVIRAFNDDMPYDQFLVRQIAADHLGESGDSLAALGFLTLGRRFINNIHDIIDDRIDVVCRGTMALTTTCARCHDHKFDPISQGDYYALYGVFASSMEPEIKDLPLLPGATPSPEYLAERAKHEQAIRDYYAGRALELGTLVSCAQGSPVLIAPQTVELLFEVRGFFTRKTRDELRELRNKFARAELSANGPPRAMALFDKPTPVTPHIFLRGSPDRPGDEVPRRFIAVLAGENARPFQKGSGRQELARAIASRDNPLTARVLVNRVWAHHFGAGLVRTPSDFGVKGDSPTHPELLDWLAADFMDGGWSIKKLHRAIMLSSVYQQSSDGESRAVQTDPENRLLSRMNRLRLDYEAMRDSLLCATGELDSAMGGRPVDIISESAAAKRRTVYAFIDRQNLPGVFRTFDFASPDATSPQRHVTTVPQQALFMLNSSFVVRQAEALVAGPEYSGSSPSEKQVQQLYRRLFARNASAEEVRAGLTFLARQAARDAAAHETPRWSYGYGKVDETTGQVKFQPLPSWSGYGWQGGKELPDSTLGWVMLSREGGHPGGDQDHCAIRRWTAPSDGLVSVSGLLARPSKEGDGIVGLIVSSGGQVLAKTVVEPGAAVELSNDHVEVKRGETIDFIVSCRERETSDSFSWAPVVRGAGGEWNAQNDFSGPRPPPPASLTPWQKYAQVLLATNEFCFVD